MSFPSIKIFGRFSHADAEDCTSAVSSSIGGSGVSGTCILRSYAWTTLSAASTALLELSVDVSKVADAIKQLQMLTLNNLNILPENLKDLPKLRIRLTFE